MEKTPSITRRAWIRLISYISALVITLSAATITGYSRAAQRQTVIEHSYQRALAQLADYMSNLESTLDKGKYATSPHQLQGLSEKLLQQAGYAKLALEQLPVSGDELSATNKFLSQIGNFCHAISTRVAAGESISDEEEQNLRNLTSYASSLMTELCLLELAVNDGRLALGETAEVLAHSALDEDVPSLADSFRELEDGFADYPTLLYDGPFSDAIGSGEPKMLKGKEFISGEQAKEAAAAFTHTDTLMVTGEIDGQLSCYRLTANQLSVAVTKLGGFVKAFVNSREMGEATLSLDEALQSAKDTLSSLGFEGMIVRYYSLNNGVLTVNFAATQGEIVLYPDLVKIGIAMDTGDAVSFDATGYLLNHHQRPVSIGKISREDARNSLSKNLTPTNEGRMVFIPNEGIGEVQCYEFLCDGEEEQVLVYINCRTGEEEQILILMQDETGVLVM